MGLGFETVSPIPDWPETSYITGHELDQSILPSARITEAHHHAWFIWYWLEPMIWYILAKHITN